MITRFHTYRRLVLPALLLLAGTASAQVAPPSGPLFSDPARAIYAPTAAQKAQHRTTALALPFFDDFTSPLEGTPKISNWKPTGGAFVNNRLAIQPLTRGTATLDGLRANGQSYSGGASNTYNTIDSLQSQPINLSSLTVNDHVYLSFAWQAGSIVAVPRSNVGRNVKLELFAKTSADIWERVWFFNSTGRITGFRQQVIDLNQAKYLHGNFQFMFVSSGNISDNIDQWQMDYVLLDSGRTRGLADTTFVDVATSAGLRLGNPSGGLRSPLRRFAAMPVWQFNAAPSQASELTPRMGVNLTNLSGGVPLIADVQYAVRDLSTGSPVSSFAQVGRLITTFPRLDSASVAANFLPVPNTTTPKRLRYTMALRSQETTTRTQPNDTIYRDVELNNYYAYDDGTAEGYTALVAYSTGSPAAFAYRFDLNRPDYVRGLRLYPVFLESIVAPRSVTISVWDNVAGRPNPVPLASKTVSIPNPLPVGWTYYQVDFDQPVPVTGSYFIGYSQPSNAPTSTGGTIINRPYAVDWNSTAPAGYWWVRNNFGAWDSTNFVLPVGTGTTRRGVLMMRPVMTNNVITATAAARDAAAYTLYPNPAHGTVSIAGPSFARAVVLDAVGRTVWAQTAAQAGQPTLPLPSLPAGVYTVRITLADGRVIGRRLLLE
jgi:hypothetical protein